MVKPVPTQHKSSFDIATWLLTDEPCSWANLGDWQQASTYADACQDLARRVGQVCQLKAGDRLLDLAFGWGASLELWQQEFQVRHIDGLELRAHCVEWVGSNLGSKEDLKIWQADWHQCFAGGQAAAEIFPDHAVYDAIVCVDALYHCSNLRDLLLACNKLLKPQGHFAATTLIHKPQVKTKWWQPIVGFTLSLAHIKPERQIREDQLIDLFVLQGYHAPVVQWLDEPVLLGFAKFIRQRRRKLTWKQRLSWHWLKIVATAWLCRLALASGEWRYALIHVQKKRIPG